MQNVRAPRRKAIPQTRKKEKIRLPSLSAPARYFFFVRLLLLLLLRLLPPPAGDSARAAADTAANRCCGPSYSSSSCALLGEIGPMAPYHAAIDAPRTTCSTVSPAQTPPSSPPDAAIPTAAALLDAAIAAAVKPKSPAPVTTPSARNTRAFTGCMAATYCRGTAAAACTSALSVSSAANCPPATSNATKKAPPIPRHHCWRSQDGRALRARQKAKRRRIGALGSRGIQSYAVTKIPPFHSSSHLEEPVDDLPGPIHVTFAHAPGDERLPRSPERVRQEREEQPELERDVMRCDRGGASLPGGVRGCLRREAKE